MRYSRKHLLAPKDNGVLIVAFESGFSPDWVLADEVYGSDSKFRRFWEEREQAYVLAVSSQQRLWAGLSQKRVDAIGRAENYVACEGCGETVSRDSEHRDESGCPICESCAEHYFTCGDRGRIIHEEHGTWNAGIDALVCDSCLDDRGIARSRSEIRAGPPNGILYKHKPFGVGMGKRVSRLSYRRLLFGCSVHFPEKS